MHCYNMYKIRLAQKTRVFAGVDAVGVPSSNPVSYCYQEWRVKECILPTSVCFLRVWDHPGSKLYLSLREVELKYAIRTAACHLL